MAPPPASFDFSKIHVFILRKCAGIAATGVCRLLPPPVSQALTATQNKHILRECAGIAATSVQASAAAGVQALTATHEGRGKSVRWHCRHVDLPVPGLAVLPPRSKEQGGYRSYRPLVLRWLPAALVYSTVAGVAAKVKGAGRMPILPPFGLALASRSPFALHGRRDSTTRP